MHPNTDGQPPINSSAPTPSPVPSAAPPPRRAPSFRTVRTLVMLAVVVLVLAFIGVRSLLRPSSPSSSSSTTVAKGAAAVCSSNAHLDVPHYAIGAQPPLALFAQSNTTASVNYQGIYVLGTAPTGTVLHDKYVAVGKNLSDTYATKKTPLAVGCITRSHEVPTEQTCKYDDGKTIPVYTAVYHLTIYDASNRHALTSKDIPTLPAYSCTSFTAYDGRAFYRSWDPTAVADALYSFVNK